MNRRLFCTLLAASFAAGALRAEEPGEWPSKPVRFVVPYAPGGATDIVGRIIAQKLSESLKEQFVVENKPGAGASVGANMVALAPADGYTLLLTNSGSHAAAPALFKNVPYDPLKDFTHIALAVTTPTVLVVNSKFSARTLGELLDHAKANPGKLDFATSGNGSSAHLVGELLMLEAGISMVHVPYRGAGPAMNDVLANQVPMMFDSLGSSSARIRSGEVRPLGISAAHRHKGFPDLPTFAEQGLPKVISTSWFGVSGPKDMPPAIQDKLAGALTRILQMPDVQARFAELDFEPSTLTSEDFAAFIESEAERWASTVQRTGIKLE